MLAVLAALAIHIGLWLGAFETPDSANFSRVVDAAHPGMAEGAAQFLSLMFSLNVLLGCFNLLPIPPLDGFSAAALLMSEEKAQRFEETGQAMRSFSYMGLLLGWRIFAVLYDPLFTLSLKLLYPTAHYGS